MVAAMIESMRAFQRAFGRAARDGAVIELPGVVACVTPGLGTHSLFNAAVHERADDLRAALPELERRYEAAGVGAWGAWVHERDTDAAAALASYGLTLDSTPAGMGRELDATVAGPAGGDVARADDLGAIDRVEAGAWGLPAGVVVDAQPGLLEQYNCYLARDERGEPAAVAATVHHRGDCGVTLVGTVPEARGRGFATAVMRAALADARRAGCRTTTLQATALGRPIYERLGYRELGTMQLWEMRAT